MSSKVLVCAIYLLCVMTCTFCVIYLNTLAHPVPMLRHPYPVSHRRNTSSVVAPFADSHDPLLPIPTDYNSSEVAPFADSGLRHLYPHDPLLPIDYKCHSEKIHTQCLRNVKHAMGRYVYQRLKNKTNGFFIECGAFDGTHLTNTLWLEQIHDWTGLLIEVDPIVFPVLKQRNRKAWMANVCLSTEVYPVLTNFTLFNGGHTYQPNPVMDKFRKHKRGIPYQAKCYPLHMLLDAIGVKQVDYFSLDVEGVELAILKTIPWHRIKIKIISVETLTREVSKSVQDYLQSVGYKKLIRLDGKSDFLLEDDVYELKS